MRTNIETIETLKELFSEILLNKTTKVTKVSDESVLNGVAYGVAKISQKGLKDIAIVESNLFPDSASGVDLDIVADRQGVPSRYGESVSSTYIRVHAEIGTYYEANVNIFKSSTGVNFQLTQDFTMSNVSGFEYVKVRSTDAGSKSNVDANTINRVVPEPTGHQYVINEFAAVGGRDVEQDELFKKRIKEAPNYLTSGTLNKLTQVFIRINPNILRTVYKRRDATGKIIIGVVTQNGVDLDNSELSELLNNSDQYLCLTEQKIFGNQTTGILIENIDYNYIDLDFRVDLYENTDPDEVRKNIQISLSKYLDFRFWDYTKKVEWDNLLNIIKTTSGVRYVADEYFNPRYDISVKKNELPRVRGFIMRNLKGNIITDNASNINPVFYQNTIDTNFSNTVLNLT